MTRNTPRRYGCGMWLALAEVRKVRECTFASLFSGFGGADIGAMDAGLTPMWGIEFDQKIAAVANQNLGDHVKVADILDCDPLDFEPVDVLHASPPCPSFSIAKTDGKETKHDVAMARKVAEFATVLQPAVVTLENVWGYRKSKSWAIIRDALTATGYWFDIAHINAADFGVPQSRHRMIVRAIRGAMVPILPPAEPHIGWYAAIEDLLDTLPDTEFAPWQLKRLPEALRSVLIGGRKEATDPAMSVTAAASSDMRAYLTTNSAYDGWDGTREADEPAFTTTTQHVGIRAALVTGDRVVAMTPRCLARFQTFPDWYTLPKSRTLAAKGIGNAVPPLLMEKLYRQLIEYAL